jgi:hypothetical protein
MEASTTSKKRVIIGSSNIDRFYKVDDYPNFTPCVMQKCCRAEVFVALMEDLSEEQTEIMVSVIENFICDSVGQEKEEKVIDAKIQEAIDTFIKVVKVTAERLKGSKFALCKPINRPFKPWYMKRVKAIAKMFCDKIGDLKLSNVSWIEAPLDKEQIFDDLGVHLIPESGVFLVETLMSHSQEFFGSEVITLDEAMETGGVEDVIQLEEEIEKSPNDRIGKVENNINNLQGDIMARRHFDSLVTARLIEVQDTELNKAREDRIVINGLTNAIPMPLAADEKIKWLHGMVDPIVNSIVPESAGMIMFINQGGNKDRGIPLCEVKFTNKDVAIKIRKSFAEQKKGGKDFGKIGIYNSVSLGTRVRIEILWAMAKKIQNEKETATVLGYSSRPTLQVKDKTGKRRPLSLGFADALGRYGKGLREDDLVSAYRKAGTAFGGQLQQNFVVLHDRKNNGKGPWGAWGGKKAQGNQATGPNPKKRAREPEAASANSGVRKQAKQK